MSDSAAHIDVLFALFQYSAAHIDVLFALFQYSAPDAIYNTTNLLRKQDCCLKSYVSTLGMRSR
jgi:hypothetical protein